MTKPGAKKPVRRKAATQKAVDKKPADLEPDVKPAVQAPARSGVLDDEVLMGDGEPLVIDYGPEYTEEVPEDEEPPYYPLPEYEKKLKYAGLQHRMMAMILDVTIVMVLIALLLMPVLAALGLWVKPYEGMPPEVMWRQVVWSNLMQVALYLVYSHLWTRRFSTTPGKFLLALRVADAATGEPLTKGQSALRSLGYLLSGLPLMLGFWAAGVDRRKQGWHDRMSRSVVLVDRVYFRRAGRWLWAWFRRYWERLTKP